MNNLTDSDLEQSVLGTLICFPETYIQVATKLSNKLFTKEEHKRIYTVIKFFAESNKPYDILSFSREIGKKNKNDVSYLTEIVSKAVTSAHIELHTMYLVELSVKRDFLFRFLSLTQLAKNPDVDIFDLRDKTFEIIDDLFLDNFIEANKSITPFKDLVEEAQHKFLSIIEGNEVTGIASSLDIINKVIGGWQKTNLTILAGRPGMGKSSFMVQQIVDVAQQDKAIGVFSLEMSGTQITSKVITNITQIPNSALLRKGLSQNQIKQYFRTKEDLVQLKIHIDDTPSITIQNLRVKAKMMKLRFDIKVLMIDYLQLIRCDASNREQEISKISQGLKALAKELAIPVIALSQLSRSVEKRGNNKRPILSDLRDSGSLEQDADEVMFLYRPAYYGIDEWDFYNHASTLNEIEIIIAKNRHGGTLAERVKVDLPTSRFMDL